MVRTQEPSDSEKLDRIVAEAAARHDLKAVVTGWSRKTYEFLKEDPEGRQGTLVVRIESFATTNGEVTLLHEDGRRCAEDLGRALEETFPDIGEAIIVDRRFP